MITTRAGTAPVILFVYNRPHHTKKTLDALSRNAGVKTTHITVYADGPRTPEDVTAVNEVKKLIRSFSRFSASLTLVERPENYGLAKNIISGVSETLQRNSDVIILEDDIETAPEFLNFMNAALQLYRDEKKIWHVSGWNYPISDNGLMDAFLWRGMNCWGWATWTDRWQQFEKNPANLLSSWNKNSIRNFNLENAYDFWNQVELNHRGKINTWAIFWYATIFKNRGLCLNPSRSLVANTGIDGSGTHCGDNDIFRGKLDDSRPSHFPEKLEEDHVAYSRIREFYLKNTMRGPWWKRKLRPVKKRVLKFLSSTRAGVRK